MPVRIPPSSRLTAVARHPAAARHRDFRRAGALRAGKRLRGFLLGLLGGISRCHSHECEDFHRLLVALLGCVSNHFVQASQLRPAPAVPAESVARRAMAAMVSFFMLLTYGAIVRTLPVKSRVWRVTSALAVRSSQIHAGTLCHSRQPLSAARSRRTGREIVEQFRAGMHDRINLLLHRNRIFEERRFCDSLQRGFIVKFLSP
jgi:hypothetical protein